MAKRFFRILCVLIFVSLSMLGCRRPAVDSGLTKIVLQADWYPQPEHGGFYTALAKGYYKDEGLDVTIQPGGPYITVEQQVASGTAQFGMGSSDKVLEAISGGQSLVAVAATMQHDPQGIMVRKDSPIHSFADLNGHSVAIKVGESTWFEFLVKRFQLNNVHDVPAMMNVANFVADPQYIQQAFATSEPFFAHQAGIETRVLLVSDAGYSPYRVMFTTQGLPPATSRNCRQVCPRIVEGMEGLPERSSRRPRHDRQAQSGAQSGVDAIYLAAIAGRPFRRGRRSERRAARPNGSKTLGHDVRTARRLESHRQTVRSHDGLHLAISSGAVEYFQLRTIQYYLQFFDNSQIAS